MRINRITAGITADRSAPEERFALNEPGRSLWDRRSGSHKEHPGRL
jgi:hypothetical protein